MEPLPHGATILDSQQYPGGKKNQDGLREMNEILRAMLEGKLVTPRESRRPQEPTICDLTLCRILRNPHSFEGLIVLFRLSHILETLC